LHDVPSGERDATHTLAWSADGLVEAAEDLV